MNNKEFIDTLSTKTGFTKEQTEKYIKTIILSMNDSFEDDEAIKINNFGTFERKLRMERVIVHPQTQKKILVPPKYVLNFKPAQIIKEELKKGVKNNG